MKCVNPYFRTHRACYFNTKNFGSQSDASWGKTYVCVWCQSQMTHLIEIFLREKIVWAHGEWILRRDLFCEHCNRSEGEIRDYYWGRSPHLDGKIFLHEECVFSNLRLNEFNSNIPI